MLTTPRVVAAMLILALVAGNYNEESKTREVDNMKQKRRLLDLDVLRQHII